GGGQAGRLPGQRRGELHHRHHDRDRRRPHGADRLPVTPKERCLMEQEHYDAVVIGSGQGGNPLANALAQAGRRTAMIEREHVGGTCINEGCTPTKTMVASARAAYLARRGETYGVHTGPVSVDMRRVRQRKRDIVESFRGGGERRLHSNGVELLMAEATFTGPMTLEVRLLDGGVRHLTADIIV